MICSKCGNIIPDSANHCPFCGAQAQGEQPMPSAQESAQTVPFCHICGLELAEGSQVCPVCGGAAGVKEKSPAFSAVYGKAPETLPDRFAEHEGFGDFADLGGAASMAVTTPIKKKSKLPLIAGIAAGVVAVLAGVFMLNRSTFLPMFMGKAGYAAMLEAKGAADAISALEGPVAEALLENAVNTASDYIITSNDGEVYRGGYSPASIIAQARAGMVDVYGKDCVSALLSSEIELTDTGKRALFGDDESYEKIVDALNACTLDASMTTGENALSFDLSLNESGAVTDARLILAPEAVYIELPFADSAMKLDIPSYGEEETAQPVKLDLDPKETSRLLKGLGDIYIKHYKSAEFTVENGELTAAGVTAKGQLVSCVADSATLNAMANEMGDFLAEDEYFCTTLVTYTNERGADITAQELKDGIKKAFSNPFDEDLSIEIKTVADSSCKVIAKSYVINGDYAFSLTLINGKEKAALEATSGSTTFTADITRVNKHDGTINIKTTGRSGFSAKLVYKDVSIKDFCGKNTLTGEVRISCVPPADFTSNDSWDKALYSALAKAELTLSQTIENGVAKQRAELSVPQYGKAAIAAEVAVKDGDPIALPENALDLGDAYSSDESLRELQKIMTAIAEKADRNGFFAAAIADAAAEEAQSIEDGFKPQADTGDIIELRETVQNLIDAAQALPEKYAEQMTDEFLSRCDDITAQLESLNDRISYSMTEERYEEVRADVEAADKLLAQLIKELNKSQDSMVVLSQRGNIDFSDLSADEMGEAFYACELDYLSIIMTYYTAISEDEELTALYDDATAAYEKAYEKYNKLVEEMNSGNWAASFVRDARKALSKFDEALTALEKKLPAIAL